MGARKEGEKKAYLQKHNVCKIIILFIYVCAYQCYYTPCAHAYANKKKKEKNRHIQTRMCVHRHRYMRLFCVFLYAFMYWSGVHWKDEMLPLKSLFAPS